MISISTVLDAQKIIISYGTSRWNNLTLLQPHPQVSNNHHHSLSSILNFITEDHSYSPNLYSLIGKFYQLPRDTTQYNIYVPSQPARNLLGKGDILFINGISLWSSSPLTPWDILVIKVNLSYPFLLPAGVLYMQSSSYANQGLIFRACLEIT